MRDAVDADPIPRPCVRIGIKDKIAGKSPIKEKGEADNIIIIFGWRKIVVRVVALASFRRAKSSVHPHVLYL